MIELGEKVRFIPAAFVPECGSVPKGFAGRPLEVVVIGTVIHVNAKHRHYTAAYEVSGYRLLESFKF